MALIEHPHIFAPLITQAEPITDVAIRVLIWLTERHITNDPLRRMVFISVLTDEDFVNCTFGRSFHGMPLGPIYFSL